MASDDKVETGTDSVFPAFCLDPSCEWERYAESQEIAKICEVLHCLDKHPELYARHTQNNPVAARRQYAPLLRTFKKWL